MKYLLLFVFGITLSFSQTITQNELDDFDGYKIVTIEPTNDSISLIDFKLTNEEYNMLFINFKAIKDKKNKILYFVNLNTYDSEIGCLSEHQSKATVLLNDKKQLNLLQFTKTDCSNSPNASFICSLSDLNAIKKSGIYKIRINGTERFKDYTIEKDTRKIINNCIDLLLKTINQ